MHPIKILAIPAIASGVLLAAVSIWQDSTDANTEVPPVGTSVDGTVVVT